MTAIPLPTAPDAAAQASGPVEFATRTEGADAAASIATPYFMNGGDTFAGTLVANDIDYVKINAEYRT